MQHRRISTPQVWFVLAFLFLSVAIARATETNFESQLRLLQEQNDAFKAQLQQQQEMIDALSREISGLKAASSNAAAASKAQSEITSSEPASATSGFSLGKVQITGEGGVGIFETGSEGAFPNAEFRVDEAKLFVDTPVWGDVYAFAELNLATRDSSDLDLRVGELYVDVEEVSQLWDKDRQLNLRIGRVDVPFGEEYQMRDVIDNPLISHSLTDIWGVDEGVELYGSFGKWSYALAVQNGGVSVTRDFTADKSVAGRLSYDPVRWLHLSVSGMRTGDLDADEELSELWFGSGWFRSLGSTNTTAFHANLAEIDLEFRLSHGHVKAFGGYVNYDDNDPTARNHRDVYYYSVEGVWDVTKKFYAAARFGQIFAAKGFPIVGNGEMGDYLYGPLADEMWRLSLGLGYRWNRHFVLKTEYTIERGREVGGAKRNHEDLFASEAAFAF